MFSKRYYINIKIPTFIFQTTDTILERRHLIAHISVTFYTRLVCTKKSPQSTPFPIGVNSQFKAL